MLPGGAFTALLLLVSGVSAVKVPPPANVTVSCQNVEVTASWEYSQQQPQTSFSVEIRGSDGRIFVRNTTDHQYNLSPFIWTTEESYLDLYYVSVTAIQEGVRSAPVLSETLTFNSLKTADKTCKLDVPPANLSMTDSGATVSFRNPVYFYRELAASRQTDGTFEFYITSNGTRVSKGSCTADQETCHSDVPFPEDVKTCVTLEGVFTGNFVGQMDFNETGEICSSDSADSDPLLILLVVLLTVAIFLIVVVTVCICKEKAWTMNIPKPTPPDPDVNGKKLYFDVKPETFSHISEIFSTPVSSKDNSGSDFPSSGGPYTSSRPSRGSIEEQEAEGLLEDGYKTGEDSLDDSEKTECISLESEEEAKGEPGPYDSPQNLQMDMGDGDTVTVYRGR